MNQDQSTWRMLVLEIFLLAGLAVLLLAFQLRVNGTVNAHSTIWAAAFSPSGDSVIVARNEGDALFDLTSGRLSHRIAGHASAVAFSPDGALVATGDFEGAVTLWDVTSGRKRKHLGRHRGRVGAVCFSPDGDILASGGYDRNVRMWSVATGKELHSLRHGRGSVYGLAFAAEGRLLATGGPGGADVLLWDVQTGERVAELTSRENGFVKKLAVASDGKMLASGLSIGAVQLWDVSKRAGIGVLPMGSTALGFSGDGALLAGGYYGGASVWETRTSSLCAELNGHGGVVTAVSLLDGRKAVTAGEDGTVVFWDLETGEPIRRIGGLYLRPGPVPLGLLAVFAVWLVAWFMPDVWRYRVLGAAAKGQLFGHCMVAGMAVGFLVNGLTIAVIADGQYAAANPHAMFGSLAFAAGVAQVIAVVFFWKSLRDPRREQLTTATAALAISSVALLYDVICFFEILMSF